MTYRYVMKKNKPRHLITRAFLTYALGTKYKVIGYAKKANFLLLKKKNPLKMFMIDKTVSVSINDTIKNTVYCLLIIQT